MVEVRLARPVSRSALVILVVLASCGLGGEARRASVVQDGDAEIGMNCAHGGDSGSTMRLSSNLKLDGAWYRVLELAELGERYLFPESGFPVYRATVTVEPIGSAEARDELVMEPGMVDAISQAVDAADSVTVLVRSDDSDFVDFGVWVESDFSVSPFVPCGAYERQRSILNMYLESKEFASGDAVVNELLRLADTAGDTPDAIDDLRAYIESNELVD